MRNGLFLFGGWVNDMHMLGLSGVYVDSASGFEVDGEGSRHGGEGRQKGRDEETHVCFLK